MTGTQKALTAAGIAAAILYAVTRSEKGEALTVDAIEGVIAGAGALARGLRNNNPGNIRWIASPGARWRGMLRQDADGFGVFDTAANGVRAIGKELLVDAGRGIRTVRGLISNWAPSNENNTAAYIAAVARRLSVAADQPLDVATALPDLAAAIIEHENGSNPYLMRDIRAWVALP
jgi:hypothetical protein